jgi:uncharacterized protein (DUF1800 family)
MSVEDVQERFGQRAYGGDQLRQRMAFALHKIWVVSVSRSPAAAYSPTIGFSERCVRPYRDLMRDITLNPAWAGI